MELDIDMELVDLLEAEAILQRLHDDLNAPNDSLDGATLASHLSETRRDELDSLLNDIIRRWLALATEVAVRTVKRTQPSQCGDRSRSSVFVKTAK